MPRIDGLNCRIEKREAFEAAQELLAREDDKVLRYVALELRRCLEAVVYEKLCAYSDGIPVEARTWQPPQAFKALLQIEPDVDQDRMFAVSIKPGVENFDAKDFVNLGTDYRPRSAWLKKTWNKLGAHLHAHWPFADASKTANTREYFKSVLDELERYVSRTFTTAMGDTFAFPCPHCKSEIRLNAKYIESTARVVCFRCGYKSKAELQEDSIKIEPEEPSIDCSGCKEKIYIFSEDLKLGHRFRCPNCSLEHEIIKVHFEVGMPPSIDDLQNDRA